MAEWDNEPDYETFVHLGFKCEIKRSGYGALCGYAHVPREHWAYGEGKLYDLSVHGGVTYSGRLDETTIGTMAESIGAHSFWVIGFDCNHAGDYSPKMGVGPKKNYKNFAYVRRELEGLCLQLSKPRDGS